MKNACQTGARSTERSRGLWRARSRRPVGLVSCTDLCTQWDSQQALLQAPRVTLRSAYVADQNSEYSACLNLLWDCPGFLGFTDPSLLKVSFLFLPSITSVSPTLWVRDTPKLQLFPPALPGDTNQRKRHQAIPCYLLESCPQIWASQPVRNTARSHSVAGTQPAKELSHPPSQQSCCTMEPGLWLLPKPQAHTLGRAKVKSPPSPIPQANAAQLRRRLS